MPGRFFVFLSQKLLLLGLYIFIFFGVFLFHSGAYSANRQTPIAIEDRPAMVAVNPLTNIAVITHGYANTDSVSIVDLSSQRIIAELPVSKLPAGVAIDTNYNIAVVTHENERLLTFIDLSTNNIIETLELETKPLSIAINSKTHIAAISSSIDKEVVFVDLNTRAVVAQTDIGIKSGDLAIDPQHNIALVMDKNKSNINIIDLNDYTPSDSIALNQKPQAIDVNPETHTAVITNYQDGSITIVDLSTKRLVTKPLGAFPLDVAINTNDNRAIILCEKDKKLLLLDLNTNEIIKTYSLTHHSRSVAINNIQNTAVIADDETDSLTIIPLPISVPLPKVKITSPQDNAQIPSNSVDVSGTVENSANVRVNDITANISGNAFSAMLNLDAGLNSILAIATDSYGRTASDDITVNIVPPVKGTITGTVTNSITGDLLDAATVNITDGQGNTQTVITNASGIFTAEVAEGSFSGTINKLWYLPNTFIGSIALGETKVINSSLTPVEPVINNINVTDITDSSATISWTTDQPTQGVVEYGTTTSYGAAISGLSEETTHSITITNLAPSTTYHFRIAASSTNGTTTYSSNSSFKTNGVIFITINSPANGANISGNSVTVTGSITNPANVETGVTVNGLPASLNNNQFVVNNVPLNAGQNTITVTATDITGTKASKSITVHATIPENYITLSVYPESGVAPLTTTLRIDGTFSIVNPIITSTGPGTVEQLVSDNPDEYKYKMTTEGTYYFTIQAAGPDGNIYQDTKAVTVLPLTQIDALLRAKWAAFSSALANKDISTALAMMHPVSSVRYQTMFNLLKDQLPDIVATHTSLALVSIINGERAWYDLKASESEGQFIYRVVFVKDANGLWRILEF